MYLLGFSYVVYYFSCELDRKYYFNPQKTIDIGLLLGTSNELATISFVANHRFSFRDGIKVVKIGILLQVEREEQNQQS